MDEAGIPSGKQIIIVGKPALNRLQYFSLGVKNTGNNPISGELWIDELRLSGVKKEKGVAMRMQSSLKLSDLGSLTAVYSRQDADYHRLQERLSRSNNSSENLNLNGKMNFDKIFPNTWGVSIPINGSFTQNQSKPKYYSGEDRLVDQEDVPDSIMTKSNSISVNTSIKKTSKSDNQFLKYTLDNVSLNLSASQSISSDVTYSERRSENYSGKFTYNIPFGRNNYIKPLIWTKNIPVVGKSFSDLHIYYTPSIFRTGLNISEKLTWNYTSQGF
jgi:cell surface protein SprA